MLATNRCYECQHQRPVPGDTHIRCANPDPNMKGHPHGVSNGWFYYPFVFDPAWMTKTCDHFEAAEGTHEHAE